MVKPLSWQRISSQGGNLHVDEGFKLYSVLAAWVRLDDASLDKYSAVVNSYILRNKAGRSGEAYSSVCVTSFFGITLQSLG